MSYEQIVEYLRSRARVEPPVDITQRVMAGIATAPTARFSFTSLLPAATALAVVTVLVVAGLLLPRGPNGGLAGSPSPIASVSITPSPTSSPTGTAQPSLASPIAVPPTASPPPGYVAVDGLPITVLDNEEADALFSEVETCVSAAGYTVEFPASWYTNAATGDDPACSWFAPEPFDVSIRPVAVNPPPPLGVWINVRVVEGGAGYVGETPIYLIEELSIGGFQGQRAEFGPTMGGVVGSPSEELTYWYLIPFAEPTVIGSTFIAATSNTVADDYPLAKAVLDRIMASITFRVGRI